MKTASFAMVHFSVAFSLAYLLTGSVALAGTLALVEPLANTVAYYRHAWQALRGRGPGALASLEPRLKATGSLSSPA